MIVTHAHFRAFRYCNQGGRAFFERYGLDWTRFVREGLPEEEILATGDAMATRLVEFAREREDERRQ